MVLTCTLMHAHAWDEHFSNLVKGFSNERGRPKADRANKTYAWASRRPGDIVRNAPAWDEHSITFHFSIWNVFQSQFAIHSFQIFSHTWKNPIRIKTKPKNLKQKCFTPNKNISEENNTRKKFDTWTKLLIWVFF